MPPLTFLGAASDHGGAIITASDTVFVNGIPVALDGSLHACPIGDHGITPITGYNTTWNGVPCATVTTFVAGCGAVIIEGSPDTVAS